MSKLRQSLTSPKKMDNLLGGQTIFKIQSPQQTVEIFRVYSVISSMVSGYFNVIVGGKVAKFQVSSGKDIYYINIYIYI